LQPDDTAPLMPKLGMLNVKSQQILSRVSNSTIGASNIKTNWV